MNDNFDIPLNHTNPAASNGVATPYKVDKDLIRSRKATLEQIKVRLKQDFVGIDPIIDNLLDYIQIWFLMPEILSRPIVVCLWGMTGVGKTDLVRKLVRYLNYQDRFCEVELGNSDNTSWYSSVASILGANGITDGKPAIVLFDEIQRFNTIEPNGAAVTATKFSDFWELLSDGRLAKRTKEDLDYYVNSFLFQQRQKKKENQQNPPAENAEPVPDPALEEIGFWEAERMKNLLNLDEDVLELADLTKNQMLEKVLEAKRQKRVYEPVDHSKTLIIISGNLDEAFQMAHSTSESDVDADIFHAFTEKITQVDIKNALTRRFRPEQVARFGNIHLIYTSLRHKHFEQLIAMEIDKIIAKTYKRFGIEVTISANMHTLIYRNGVFPVQGVRPVFSSIIDILETNLSKFLFMALLDDTYQISVDYSFDTEEIVAKLGSLGEVRLPYVGRIDKIRERNVEAVVSNISVHEAGHAVAYVALFGLAPLQLKSKVASSYAGGFTFPHQIYRTKDSLVRKVMVYLAGAAAERLVFGEDNTTVGGAYDREQASMIIMDYIRQYGFDPKFQTNYGLPEPPYVMDRKETDAPIEAMMSRLSREVYDLLEKHRDFLVSLSRQLYRAGSMETAEVAEVAKTFGLTADIKEEGYLHAPTYQHLLGKDNA